MSHHATEGDPPAMRAAPLACPHCGCSELLHAVELTEVLAATPCAVDGPRPEATCRTPLREGRRSPEQGAIACRDCGRLDLQFDQLVPDALPPSRVGTSEPDS